jgi:predicted acyl esterase
MVQVQSTWIPVIDRNPQKSVENIFLAKAMDYQQAEQRDCRSPKSPAHLTLAVHQPSGVRTQVYLADPIQGLMG